MNIQLVRNYDSIATLSKLYLIITAISVQGLKWKLDSSYLSKVNNQCNRRTNRKLKLYYKSFAFVISKLTEMNELGHKTNKMDATFTENSF